MSDAPSKAEALAGKFKYPPHPIAAIFLLLDPTSSEFLALVDDIKENDLREPICIYEDKILDGRNRALALEISGRRHLNESQRAMVGAKMASFEVGDNQHKLEGVSIDTASKLLNVGRASIARARKVLGFGDPETIEKVVAGKLSVSKAAAQVTGQDGQDGQDKEGPKLDEADHEALLEYDTLETKLLTKLGDLSAAKAEEHSEITIAKTAKAAKQKVA